MRMKQFKLNGNMINDLQSVVGLNPGQPETKLVRLERGLSPRQRHAQHPNDWITPPPPLRNLNLLF